VRIRPVRIRPPSGASGAAREAEERVVAHAADDDDVNSIE
jgi:hypothetical protein